ncbi:V-type proton ATPase subunit S1-like [Arapaima gigas]
MAENLILRFESVTVVFSVLLNVFSTGVYGHQVPLIMWSSAGTPFPEASPAAGHIVSASQLSSYLWSALSSGPHTILLFQQEKLSIDDFTVFGGLYGNEEDGAFPNLKSALQASTSQLLLPSVSQLGSSSILQLLREQLLTNPLYVDPKSLADLHLNASEPALLVIQLSCSSGTDLRSSKKDLRRADQVIGDVLNIMKEQAIPYTAIYTAQRPSLVIREQSPDVQLVGRSLLQTEVYTPVQFSNTSNNTCILFWANNFTVSLFKTSWELQDLTSQTFAQVPQLNGSSCSGTDSRLSINYENVLGFKSFSVTFVMRLLYYTMSARKWFILDQILLQYDNQNATFNDTRNIYAPGEYSYRCESVSMSNNLLLNSNDNKWILSFRDFQIQGFSVTNGQFSYASDCASFFTPGIWMGLLISLMMLLILTYGLHMIMHVRTVDRFDDPKGPSISVPQNE